ncbi:S8 family serine peptidase [Candidatus Woesearchaeota archaeon]|nr:S8 family serine peptidase [Candidatus Woesearchaeota archaeon]
MKRRRAICITSATAASLIMLILIASARVDTAAYDRMDHAIATKTDGVHGKEAKTILDQFEKQGVADVVVLLKENKISKATTRISSGVLSTDAKAERKRYVHNHVSSVLQTLRGPGLIASSDVTNEQPFEIIDGFTIRVSKRGYDDLRTHPEVLGVFPNYEIKLIEPEPPAEPGFGTDFNIANPTVSAIFTRDNLNLTGAGIKVAVIDTGIDYTHATLGNCTETAFLNGSCAKVFGGFDFCGNGSSSCGTGLDNNPMDDNGHGTHVASIIGGNNHSGYIGIAPNVTFLAIKSFHNSGSGTTAAIIQGIDFAIANDVDIIQASFGSILTPDTGFDATGIVASAAPEQYGIAFIASAGNSGAETESSGSPAVARGIVSVAATNDQNTADVADDTIASFSSRGPFAFGRFGPTLTAPGTSINASAPPLSRCPGNPSSLCSDAGFNAASGTSFSAPIVAGIVAQILQAKPNITIPELRLIISSSAQNMTGHPFEKGAGLANATAAITFKTRAMIDGRENTALEAIPGQYADTNVSIFNLDNASAHTYTFLIESIGDLEGEVNISPSFVDLPRIQTLAAGANSTYQVRFNVPSSQRPGILGTTISIRSDTGENLRVPVALTIPLVGDGTILGTVNDGQSSTTPGDLIYYKLIAPNGTQMNLLLDWPSGGDDLDLYLFSENGVREGTSGAGSGTNETINISSTSEKAYWVLVNGFTMSARTNYTLRVTYVSNLSISPATSTASARIGATTNLSFRITNNAVAKPNISLTLTRLQTGSSIITTVNATGNSSFDRFLLSNLSINTTRIKDCDLISNWSNKLISVNLGYFGRTPTGDIIQSPKAQHSNPDLNDSRQYLRGLDLSYYNTNYTGGVGVYVQNLNLTPTFVTLNISCRNFHPASEATLNESFLTTLDSDASRDLLAVINGTGVTASTIRDYRLYIENANRTFAEAPIRIIYGNAVAATNYTGNTTNFDTANDVSNLPNITLQIPGKGQIRWLNRINALGADFDSAVRIADRFIAVNESSLSSTFNTSAIVTIEGIRCANFVGVRRNPAFVTSIDTLFAGGGACNQTSTPSCANITCANDKLTFTPSTFSSYAADELNLTADINPSSIPIGGTVVINGTVLVENASPLADNTVFVLLNGTVTNTTTGANGIFNATRIAPSVNGTYLVLVNTTRGNVTTNLTLTLSVTAIGPRVTNVSPTTGTTFNQTNLIRISANATGIATVTAVFANVSLPNGTRRIIILNGSGDIFNGTFAETASVGSYPFFITAVDDNGAANTTVNSSFIITDVTRPTVHNLTSNPGVGNQTNTFNLTATVLDNGAVGTVLFNVSNTTHVVVAQLVGAASSSIAYSVGFNTSSTTRPGNYSFKIVANDTFGNLNDTINSSFVINDVTNPVVVNLSTTPGIGNQTNTFNVSVAATDTIAIDSVLFNICPANSVCAPVLTGVAIAGSRYLVTYNTTLSSTPGAYNVTVAANDTSGNLNQTMIGQFTVNDITRPEVFGLISTPVIGNQSNTFNITFNVSDNFQLSNVTLNVSLASGAPNVLGTTENTPGQRSAIFTTTASTTPGNYTYRIIANDTSGNLNDSATSSLVVNDLTNPAVLNLSPSAGSNLAQTPFRIAVNATDNHAVLTVRANVTGAVNLLAELFNTSSQPNIWNVTAQINVTGEYNITIIANDSQNNINATIKVAVNVTDQTAPNVSAPSSHIVIGNQSTVYNLSGLIVDPFANSIDTTRLNVSAPNGSFVTSLILTNSGANRYSALFNTTSSTLPGNYTYSIIANDTRGNTNISTSTFIVNDITAPAVIDLRSDPIIGNQSNTFNISANVSDNTNGTTVSTVVANVTVPGGAVTSLVMIRQGTSAVFSAEFNTTLTSAGGNYSYRIIATDSFSNVNLTQTSTFIVNDGTAPLVANLSSLIVIGNQTQSFNISAAATDNGAVDAVRFNIINTSGVVIATLLGTPSGGARFAAVFNTTSSTSPGNYTYRVLANDTAGNVNETITSSFIVNDVTAPTVENLSSFPINGNQSNTFNVSAAVSDTTILGTVLFNISNSTNVVVSTLVGVSIGNERFLAQFNTTSSASPGNYTYRIIANDSSGNTNTILLSTFIVNDITRPTVVDLRSRPILGNQSNTFNVTANVSDNINVGTVRFNITNPSGSVVATLTAVASASGEYSATFNTSTTTSPGNYTYRVIANDSSGNLNSTASSTFVIADIITPTVSNIQPTSGSTAFANETVTVSVNATDNSAIRRAVARVVRPDGIGHELNLTNTTLDIFSSPFTLTNITGQYNISISVNDTWNNTANISTTFTVVATAIVFSKTILTENPTNTSRNVIFRINISNLGSSNLTNITFRDTYDQAYLNFTTSSITIENSSNSTGTLIVNEILDDNHGAGSVLQNGTSITFNITYRALRNNTNTTNVANITFRDASGNLSSIRRTADVEIRSIPAVATAFVNGTNFSAVNDITNVSNATIANDNGTILWVNTIDASGANFDAHVRIIDNATVLNTSAFSRTLNSSAVLQIRGISCPVATISFIENFSASLSAEQIRANGRDCAGFGICSNVSCSSGVLSFTVAHFSGFAAGATANLTIGATGAQVSQPINFTAIYLNITNGAAISGASCNVSVSTINLTMTNISSGYNATTTSLGTAGTFNYNITCAAPGFTTLLANDTVAVTAVPSSASAGGGGGSSSIYSSQISPSATATKIASSTESGARRTYTAFDLIDIIKEYYAGVKKYTTFEIVDLIKDHYAQMK